DYIVGEHAIVHPGEADDGACSPGAAAHGQRDRGLRVDGLCARTHVAARVILEVAGLHGLIALPRDARHALAARDRRRRGDHGRRDVDRRRDREIFSVDDVDGAGDGAVTCEQLAQPAVHRFVEHLAHTLPPGRTEVRVIAFFIVRPAAPQRALIVAPDDDPRIRELRRSLHLSLDRHGVEVVAAAELDAATRWLATAPCDVAFVHGPIAGELALRAGGRLPVIALCDDLSAAIGALDAGATDGLVGEVTDELLVLALRRAARYG